MKNDSKPNKPQELQVKNLSYPSKILLNQRVEIARIYDRLPKFDEQALPAYRQFAREIQVQYKLLQTMGLELIPTPEDPYRTSLEMFADVGDNFRLKYYTGGEEHPTLKAVNNEFRAVHDYFGHFVSRCNFSANGEEQAWLNHSKMFSPLAIQAMTSETRGQNSWFNYSPGNVNLKPKNRTFAEQKTALLPLWCSELTVTN